nr:ribonuclease H-like domain-containing protein [Tanacetum cinerariifolium]
MVFYPFSLLSGHACSTSLHSAECEVVAWLAEGTFMLVAPDALSTMMENLFSWVFFLTTKDETSKILKTFITEIENQLDCKVKVIRTPQQNGVAEKKNRTLIKAARTMDYLGKFDEKANEGFFVRYSVVSKAMRVFNKRTRIVKETLNIIFLENAPNVKVNGPDWLFDIDSLTISMNYVPVVHDFKLMDTRSEFEGLPQQERQTKPINSTNSFNTLSSPVSTAGPSFVNAASPSLINAAGTPASTNAFEKHLSE